MSAKRFVRVEVVEDRTADGAERGFLRLRRWVLRNAYDDGTFGPTYSYDVVEREALDAVTIAAYARTSAGVAVWIRRCLRPPLLSRRRLHVPLDWPEGETTVLELPAGLVDPGERGWEGVRAAGARELLEETGIDVPASELRALGAPFLLSPGVVGEMIFPLVVEVPAAVESAAAHDGEEVERGAEVVRLPLEEAIARVGDAKSEILLRRLRESLR